MTRALVLLLFVTTPLIAQQPAFKSGIELVRIPVSLTQGNKPVEPGVLTAADFTVVEDGVEQSVSVFERESLPLSICVVFDASASMGMPGFRQPAVAAVNEVVAQLRPTDEIIIIAFNDQPRVILPWSYVRNISGLAITLETKGATSLHDAVVRGLEVINSARNPRPVMLLITDGGENASRTSLAKLVTSRRQSETQISAFNISLPYEPQFPSPVAAIVGDSGGVEYRVRSGMDDLAVRARAFVGDLRSQYTIGYSPMKPLDGGYRTVRVELKRRGVSIRHRGGYLAVPAQTP